MWAGAIKELNSRRGCPASCVSQCPNEFVVGYGLDFNERFRCLPYVAALKESAYS